MDKESPDLSHGADRDRHFLAAPHVPLLEEHVGYMVAGGFHDEPLGLPYLAVGRADGQVAAYVYLARRDGVDGDLLRGSGLARSAGNAHPGVRKRPVHLIRVPVPGGVEVRYGLSLLGGPERLELGEGAAKPDPARRSVHKVNGNKPSRALPVLRVDCEMSDLPGGRVEDDAAHPTAGTIGATGVGPDPERHYPRHGRPPRFPWTLASTAGSSTSELPGHGQPHLAGHSPGHWHGAQRPRDVAIVRDECASQIRQRGLIAVEGCGPQNVGLSPGTLVQISPSGQPGVAWRLAACINGVTVLTDPAARHVLVQENLGYGNGPRCGVPKPGGYQIRIAQVRGNRLQTVATWPTGPVQLMLTGW